MQASKEFIRSLSPAFAWKVPSKSEKGKYHIVGYSEKRGWSCGEVIDFKKGWIPCIAYAYSKKPKTCKHIQLVKMQWK